MPSQLPQARLCSTAISHAFDRSLLGVPSKHKPPRVSVVVCEENGDERAEHRGDNSQILPVRRLLAPCISFGFAHSTACRRSLSFDEMLAEPTPDRTARGSQDFMDLASSSGAFSSTLGVGAGDGRAALIVEWTRVSRALA